MLSRKNTPSLHFGHIPSFSEKPPLPTTLFSIQFRPIDLMSKWQRCGLTADFISQFETIGTQQLHTKSILSSIMNELLENAVKFSCEKKGLVEVKITSLDSHLIIEVKNTTDKQDAKTLIQFITTFLDPKFDPETFFIEQIEKGENVGYGEGSQLGFYTITQNYHAKLGIKITTNSTTESEITTIIELDRNTQKEHHT